MLKQENILVSKRSPFSLLQPINQAQKLHQQVGVALSEIRSTIKTGEMMGISGLEINSISQLKI